MDAAFWFAVSVPMIVSTIMALLAGVSWLAVRRIFLDAHQVRGLAGRLAVLDDELSDMRMSLKRLHSRAGMRELRERRSSNGASEEIPDWQTDPEGFRAAARAEYLHPRKE
jgi:hypothetical protein